MTTGLFDSIDDAIAAIARGDVVVVADDEDRENEGNLIMAADTSTEDQLAFFVRHTSGVICVGLTDERCDELDLALMVPPGADQESQGTAFTISVDLKSGTSTGISAADRARTLRALADANIDSHGSLDAQWPGCSAKSSSTPGAWPASLTCASSPTDMVSCSCRSPT